MLHSPMGYNLHDWKKFMCSWWQHGSLIVYTKQIMIWLSSLGKPNNNGDGIHRIAMQLQAS